MDNPPNDFDEAAIIRKVLEGDVNAFELLLGRHQGHVTRIVMKHVPRDKIEDLAHETFVRAYQSLESYQGARPFKHWLSTIALRCCYDHWRDHYRHREKPVSALSEDCREWMERLLSDRSQDSFAEYARKREAIEVLHWALDRLSAADRTVLTLTYLEGYTVAQAAELLRWSVANVKVRSFRARKKLRNILLKAMPDHEE